MSTASPRDVIEALARGLAEKRYFGRWDDLKPFTRAAHRTLGLTIIRILTAAGYTIAPPGSRLVPEGWDDRAIASLRRAVDLAEAMLTNDPNEPISDAGHTLLEWWQSEIEVLRAALRALAEAKP